MTNWYPITAMKVAHVPVWVSGPGFEVMAEIRRHEKLSKPGNPVWWWMEILKTGKTRELAAVGIADGDARRGLRTAPVLFRPLDPSTWPHGLPAPVSVPYPPAPEPSSLPAEPDDGTMGGDGWPYPGLWLGSLAKPDTAKECEARLLRAIRTMRSRSVAGAGNFGSSYCADIPREMADIALKFAEAERIQADGPSSELAAVRSGWLPTRRDLTDWLYCLEWMRVLNGTEFLILDMRAADPVWTYRLIGEDDDVKLSPDDVRGVYKRAVQKAFRRARR